jgi:acyl-coenzyme A thioesterase PaaI-like protein
MCLLCRGQLARTLALGINASVTFLKAVRGGELIAEAVENSVNPRLGSYTVTVHTRKAS